MRGLALVLVVAAGSIAAVVGLLMVGRPDGLLGSSVVCLEADAHGGYPEGSCPPIVIPVRQEESARVTVEVPNADPGWIHGGYFYMRASKPDGQVVLEQQLAFQRDDDGGPAASGVLRESPTAVGEAYLTPGTYELTVYGRSCGDGLWNSDGTCGVLYPPSLECAFMITVEPDELVAVGYDWTIPACGESAASP